MSGHMQMKRRLIFLGASIAAICVLCFLVWVALHRDHRTEEGSKGRHETEPAEAEANYSPCFRGVSLRFDIVNRQETYHVGLPIVLKAVLTNHSDNAIVTNPVITNNGPSGINLHVNYETVTGERFYGAEGIDPFFVLGGWPSKVLKPAEAVMAHWTFVPILPGKVQLRAYYHHTEGNGYWVNSREITVSDTMAPEMRRTYGELGQRLKQASPRERSVIYAEVAEQRHILAARFLMEHLSLERDPGSRQALVKSMCRILVTGAGFDASPVFFALAQDQTEVPAVRCLAIDALADMYCRTRYTDPWTGELIHVVSEDTRARAKSVIAALVSDPDPEVAKHGSQWMRRLEEEE